MARFEIEFSDRIGSWSAYGRRFTPGVYYVEDERIAAAARTFAYARVTELPEEAPPPEVVAYVPDVPQGLLTVQDLKSAAKEFLCDVEGCERAVQGNGYANAGVLAIHKAKKHPAPEVQEPEAADEGGADEQSEE